MEGPETERQVLFRQRQAFRIVEHMAGDGAIIDPHEDLRAWGQPRRRGGAEFQVERTVIPGIEILGHDQIEARPEQSAGEGLGLIADFAEPHTAGNTRIDRGLRRQRAPVGKHGLKRTVKGSGKRSRESRLACAAQHHAYPSPLLCLDRQAGRGSGNHLPCCRRKVRRAAIADEKIDARTSTFGLGEDDPQVLAAEQKRDRLHRLKAFARSALCPVRGRDHPELGLAGCSAARRKHGRQIVVFSGHTRHEAAGRRIELRPQFIGRLDRTIDTMLLLCADTDGVPTDNECIIRQWDLGGERPLRRADRDVAGRAAIDADAEACAVRHDRNGIGIDQPQAPTDRRRLGRQVEGQMAGIVLADQAHVGSRLHEGDEAFGRGNGRDLPGDQAG